MSKERILELRAQAELGAKQYAEATKELTKMGFKVECDPQTLAVVISRPMQEVYGGEGNPA